MRFATGAVLIPHGIQKIMLGSAANLAVVIDKQMGVSFPLMWAYFAVFAESVGAICLAIGLFTRFCAAAIVTSERTIAMIRAAVPNRKRLERMVWTPFPSC